MRRIQVTLDIRDWENILDWLSTHSDRTNDEWDEPQWEKEYQETENSIKKLRNKVLK